MTNLPTSLAKLDALTDLQLAANQLAEFPACILDMKSLKRLDLQRNKLARLPEDLAALGELQLLRLSGNAFSTNEVQRIREALPDCMIQF